MFRPVEIFAQKSLVAVAAVLLIALSLASCKRPEPEDTRSCAETIKVTQRNGVDVVQTVSGLYLRAKVRGFGYGCGRTPETRHLVDNASFWLPWAEGQFEPEIGPGYTEEQWDKLSRGAQAQSLARWRMYGAFVTMDIGFGNAKLAQERADKGKADGYFQDWWYASAIPHKLYPIDLLPNWNLKDGPDPQAGFGRIEKGPPKWAIRGLVDTYTKRPYTTFCDMNSPPEWDGKDFRPEVTKELDPIWLVQATTLKSQNGNTCRGSVGADSGVDIGGRLDVPGKAVPEIDKVYKATANLLSNLNVE